jgi:hypothetical protein
MLSQAIDKGGCGGTGCGYGVPAWKRAYMFSEKHMYKRDNSWPYDDVGSYYCQHWSCVYGLHKKGQNIQPSFTRGKVLLNATMSPIAL